MDYKKRAELIKTLSEQQYFDARLKNESESARIGDRDGRTGRHLVLRQDGGVTSNGVKTFNTALPTDGFVRNIQGANAIALDHRNAPPKPIKKPIQAEPAEPIEILVSYEDLYFAIVSGNGVSGTPVSDASVFAEEDSLPIASQDGVIYTLNEDSGALLSKEGELSLRVNSGGALNTITNLSTPIQDFGGDKNEIGITISGAFVDHPSLSPPSGTDGFISIYLKFNLAAQTFLKEWDVISPTIKPIQLIDDEILILDELRNLDKRAIVLTKLIADTNLIAKINEVVALITARRLALGDPFFALGLELTLGEVIKDKLNDIPAELPIIDPLEEFYNLSTNINGLIPQLNLFISFPTLINSFNAEIAARLCTKEGERVIVLNAFIVANSFTNYSAFIRSVPFRNQYFYAYRRTGWNSVAMSPLDIEAAIAGVSYSNDFGVLLVRQGDFYYVQTDLGLAGLPFNLPEYRLVFKWRKRGNVDWFSI